MSQGRPGVVGGRVGGVCRSLALLDSHAGNPELPWAWWGGVLLEMLIVGGLFLLVLRLRVGLTIRPSLQDAAPVHFFAVVSK